MPLWLLPALTAILAIVFAVALLDQWLERGRGFQLAWAVGMLLFGIGSAAEAIAAAAGWSDALYRAWYLAGAVLTPGVARPRDGLPARPDPLRLHVWRAAVLLRPDRADDPQLAELRGSGTAAAALPDRRGHPRAGDRDRDLLPERLVDPLRRRSGRRVDDPRDRPDVGHGPAAARATRSTRRRASRPATSCRATCGSSRRSSTSPVPSRCCSGRCSRSTSSCRSGGCWPTRSTPTSPATTSCSTSSSRRSRSS